MSYQIGQLRRNNISSYTKSLDYSLINVSTKAGTQGNIVFTDRAMQLTATTSIRKNYYLNFSIGQIANMVQNVKIYLQKSSGDSNTQLLKTYKVLQGTNRTNFEFIFTPNSEYNQIVFLLERTPEDFITLPSRIVDLQINNYEEIIDIMPTLGIDAIKKLGVQGPPGLLMCINGEEIRVGRTGIYEMLEDIDVTSIGFILKESEQRPDKLDYFILDYQY